MLKRFFPMGLLAIFLLLVPVTTAFAEENGDNGASLVQGPFVIVAFATLILMTYYMFRD